MLENQAQVATKEKFFYGHIITLVCSFIMAIAWGPTYTYGIFIKPLQAEFGWTRAVTAIAYSLIMFVRGLFHIVAGRTTDRFGPRLVVSVSAIFVGLGYVLMSQISTVWQLYLFYGVIIAIGVSGDYIPLVSTVARWFTRSRGMMTGLVMAGVSVGTMIMPPVVQRLISAYDWRTTFALIGIASFVLIMAAAQFLKYSPAEMGLKPYGAARKENDLDSPMGGLSFRQSIYTRQFWLMLGVFFCQYFALQVILVHLVPHITDQGISAMIAASALTTIGATSLAGRMMAGGLADRFSSKKSLLLCISLLSASLPWLLIAREMWMFYFFAAVFGLGYGGIYTLTSPMVAELFGLRSHGVIMGIITFAGTVGGAIGPALAGYIFDISSSYQMAFLVTTILSVISLILLLPLRPMASSGGTND